MISQDLTSCSESEDLNDEGQGNEMNAAEQVCVDCTSVNEYGKKWSNFSYDCTRTMMLWEGVL